MHPAIVILANQSPIFGLYDFHLQGVAVETLARAYSLPPDWVAERIEAIRLCVKYQVEFTLNPPRHGNECSKRAAA